ncbi:MAG: DUF308 domain-containing protein [Candidatus Eisenbacteria bacterium]
MAGVMSTLFQRTWWSLLIKGLAALVFGLLAIAAPTALLKAVITIFGIFVLVVGIVATVGAAMHRKESKMWMLVFVPGLVGIIIGIISIVAPSAIAVIFVYLIAIWALVIGIGELYGAFKLRKDIAGEWVPIVTGALAVLLGLILLIKPMAAGKAFMLLVGFFFLVMGLLWLLLAFRARKWHKVVEKTEAPPQT